MMQITETNQKRLTFDLSKTRTSSILFLIIFIIHTEQNRVIFQNNNSLHVKITDTICIRSTTSDVFDNMLNNNKMMRTIRVRKQSMDINNTGIYVMV